MPIVEILSFSATEAYLSDENAAKPTLSIVAQQPGVISIYHGTTVQSPKDTFLVIVWESQGAIKAFLGNEPAQKAMSQERHAVSNGLKFLNIVELNSDPHLALNAPITEVGLFTLHEGVDVHTFVEKLGDLSEILDRTVPAVGKFGSGAGIVKEKLGDLSAILDPAGPAAKEREEEVNILVGWESLKHFELAATTVPGVQEAIKTLVDLGPSDRKIVHVPFTKFK